MVFPARLNALPISVAEWPHFCCRIFSLTCLWPLPPVGMAVGRRELGKVSSQTQSITWVQESGPPAWSASLCGPSEH